VIEQAELFFLTVFNILTKNDHLTDYDFYGIHYCQCQIWCLRI